MATSSKKPTSARGWKKVSKGEPLELPSGNVALVRRPGLPELMAAGVFPDSLTPIAQRAAEAGKSGKGKKNADAEAERAMREVMGDPDKMAEMMDVFDRATAMCVVEPKCIYYKDAETGKILDEEQREAAAQLAGFDSAEDVVFSDEVDSTDKMYIFNFAVGGTRDLEQFRQQHGELVEGLERSKNVEV